MAGHRDDFPDKAGCYVILAANFVVGIIRSNERGNLAGRQGGSMAYADYAPGEITTRGEAIYLEQVFPKLDQGERGKFVSIDIESGDYEIDAEDPFAFQRLLERRPEGVFYGVRVGYWGPDGRPVSGYLGFWPRND